MSLRDANCYTLTLSPSSSDPSIVELHESFGNNTASSSQARYARVRENKEGEAYSSSIYDVLTGAKLASAGYQIEKDKKRRLQLHGPDEQVPFEFTGRINFEWTFEFEGNKYRWTREVYGKDYICSLDRKPDPRVEICLARDAGSKGPARLQVLHYNIDRFPDAIKDLRGLETLLVASLLCLLDAANDRNTPLRSLSNSSKRPKEGKSSQLNDKDPPPVPPKPERVISEDDFEPENPNEIVVTKTSNMDNHIARAIALLQDPTVLFIVIRTKTSEAVQKALELSLAITRFRHHEGLPDLHQYVIEEAISSPTNTSTSLRPGPKVIKLDDEPPVPPAHTTSNQKKAWTPPPNIVIYLSMIELPDLKPGRREHLQHVASISSSSKPKMPSPTPPAPSTSAKPQEEVKSNDTNPSKRTSSFGKLFRSLS